MSDLRWVDGPLGYQYLRRPDGTDAGFISVSRSGFFGIICTPPEAECNLRSGPQISPEAARAWVETEVRRLGETIPSVEKKET